MGSQGSKGHFHQNCSNLSILNSLTIILKHMHELETPTYVVGSKINLGSLGILQMRAGFVSFQRHTVLVLLSFFLTICIFFHMLDRISTKLGQNDQWVSGYKSYALFDLKGHVRVTRGQKGHFYGKCISSYMLYWILTKLGQKHQWISGYKSYALFDLKGHVEVTGVKKVIYF